MRRSSVVVSLTHGDRPSRRQDVPTAAGNEMVTVPRIFLDDVLDTLNRVPNLRLDHDRWRSTYGMAAALTDFLKRTATPPPPRSAETDPPEGDG